MREELNPAIERVIYNNYKKSGGSTKSEKRKLSFRISCNKLRLINWCILGSIFLCGTYMFRIKSNMQDLKFAQKQINSQINNEKKQYSLLKAELAYLRSPERIRELASLYLDFKTINPSQMASATQKKHLYGKTRFSKDMYNDKKMRWRFKNHRSDLIRTSYIMPKTIIK